jgi:hypothetical protein
MPELMRSAPGLALAFALVGAHRAARYLRRYLVGVRIAELTVADDGLLIRCGAPRRAARRDRAGPAQTRPRGRRRS